MFGRKRSRDTSKYCHFHEDYEHDTNDCRRLKVHIQEAINSGQLLYLVKGIKKENAKSTDTPEGKARKTKSDSPHNMLMGRTALQKMGIVVSTIHGAIKFYTKKGARTALSVGEAEEETTKTRRTLTISKQRIPSYDDTEEKIIVNDKQKENTLDRRSQKAFKEIKKFFQALLMLIAPRAGETLIMYLTASKESTNAALFEKRSEGKILIYFVSRVLQGAKLNYPVLEKLILALVHAARRLQRYFQAHTIMVLTGMPIKEALTGPEQTGRVAKWAIKLGEYDIVFLKRDERETPADFLPEIPFDDSEKRVKEKEVPDPSNEWKLYTDRASSSDGAGAGLMLIDPV
nr:reverse transcriptase domain-containing protein [Tanacetum cinerariifolium]